jgi:hypothetical protein
MRPRERRGWGGGRADGRGDARSGGSEAVGGGRGATRVRRHRWRRTVAEGEVDRAPGLGARWPFWR